MNAKQIFRLFFILLTIITMIVIFALSNEPAASSSITSSSFIGEIAPYIIPGFQDLSELEQSELISSMQNFVRKLAHFLIYTALGFFATSSLYTFNLKGFSRFSISLSFCFLYATSDELHQYFIPGRACRFSDILIDTSGAIFGAMLVFGFAVVFGKIKCCCFPNHT